MAITYLQRPEGRLASELTGTTGELVVCVPAMGELRQSYRMLAPLLVARGYRVVTLDLRGHGDSDATFSSYDDEALASDILALIETLGEPVLIVGNSMGAGAAVIAAAERPAAVTGLALLGPFVRNPAGSAFALWFFHALMTKPWGPAAFAAYYPQWMPGERPADYEAHRAAVRANLKKPGHWRAFASTTRTSHALAESLLPTVRAAGVPAVVVMGDADVDWKDPAAEARWIGDRLDAEVVMLPGVGHYPQAQRPEATAAAILAVLGQASAGSSGRARAEQSDDRSDRA